MTGCYQDLTSFQETDNMSYIQAIIASISASTGNGGGGGGGGGGPTFGSWTIEWWEKKLSPQTVSSPRVFAVGVDTSASIGYSNESGGDYIWTGGTGTGPITVGSIVNAWHHFAICSDGTNLNFFKDGVLLTSATRAGSVITDASTPFYLGGDTNFCWKGRITDLHILKGVAKYTANFTAPSARLSTESNTVLLYQFMDNTFTGTTGPSIDTNTGTTYSTDSPFGAGQGGSVQFAGTTSSYLKWAGSSIFALDA